MNGSDDALQAPAIDPAVVGKVRRAEFGIAPGVFAMTGHAGRLEHFAAPGHLVDVFCGRYGRIAERADIGCDVDDLLAVEHLVAAECRHLADAGLRMAGIHADGQGLRNRLRPAAPDPVVVGEVGIVFAALAVASVAGGAVVAKQLMPRRPHRAHQRLVGAHRVEGKRFDLLCPGKPQIRALGDRGFHGGLVIRADDTLRIGVSERQSGIEDPPEDGEQMCRDQEQKDTTRDGRVQLLDAVPDVSRGFSPADGIDLFHFHGPSSSSKISRSARSKRSRLEGRKV